jgi:hypothetical protein
MRLGGLIGWLILGGTMEKMTRYQRAKYIACFATAANTGLTAFYKLVEYPYLTDEECKQLAIEMPYSFADIRQAFKTKGRYELEQSAKAFSMLGKCGCTLNDKEIEEDERNMERD